jgi:hypothetical protein
MISPPIKITRHPRQKQTLQAWLVPRNATAPTLGFDSRLQMPALRARFAVIGTQNCPQMGAPGLLKVRP